MIKVKICGLTRDEDIDIVNKHLPDYAGFVFAKSSRQISPENAERLIKKLDKKIMPVGIFVDANIFNVCHIAVYCKLHAVQLHGMEDAEYIESLKQILPDDIKIFKALKVKDGTALKDSDIPCDMYFLDTFKDGVAGGSGETFNWDLIKDCNIPYFLAGGLNCENIKDAIKRLKPYGVDVSSGVETNGVKDEIKISKFIEIVRCATDE